MGGDVTGRCVLGLVGSIIRGGVGSGVWVEVVVLGLIVGCRVVVVGEGVVVLVVERSSAAEKNQ